MEADKKRFKTETSEISSNKNIVFVGGVVEFIKKFDG